MLKEQIMSLPIRGARIEIVDAFASLNSSSSLPTQGTRIEINWSTCSRNAVISLPMQGARIEIDDDYKGMTFDIIAPYTGDEN